MFTAANYLDNIDKAIEQEFPPVDTNSSSAGTSDFLRLDFLSRPLRCTVILDGPTSATQDGWNSSPPPPFGGRATSVLLSGFWPTS